MMSINNGDDGLWGFSMLGSYSAGGRFQEHKEEKEKFMFLNGRSFVTKGRHTQRGTDNLVCDLTEIFNRKKAEKEEKETKGKNEEEKGTFHYVQNLWSGGYNSKVEEGQGRNNNIIAGGFTYNYITPGLSSEDVNGSIRKILTSQTNRHEYINNYKDGSNGNASLYTKRTVLGEDSDIRKTTDKGGGRGGETKTNQEREEECTLFSEMRELELCAPSSQMSSPLKNSQKNKSLFSCDYPNHPPRSSSCFSADVSSSSFLPFLSSATQYAGHDGGVGGGVGAKARGESECKYARSKNSDCHSDSICNLNDYLDTYVTNNCDASYAADRTIRNLDIQVGGGREGRRASGGGRGEGKRNEEAADTRSFSSSSYMNGVENSSNAYAYNNNTCNNSSNINNSTLHEPSAFLKNKFRVNTCNSSAFSSRRQNDDIYDRTPHHNRKNLFFDMYKKKGEEENENISEYKEIEKGVKEKGRKEKKQQEEEETKERRRREGIEKKMHHLISSYAEEKKNSNFTNNKSACYSKRTEGNNISNFLNIPHSSDELPKRDRKNANSVSTVSSHQPPFSQSAQEQSEGDFEEEIRKGEYIHHLKKKLKTFVEKKTPSAKKMLRSLKEFNEEEKTKIAKLSHEFEIGLYEVGVALQMHKQNVDLIETLKKHSNFANKKLQQTQQILRDIHIQAEEETSARYRELLRLRDEKEEIQNDIYILEKQIGISNIHPDLLLKKCLLECKYLERLRELLRDFRASQQKDNSSTYVGESKGKGEYVCELEDIWRSAERLQMLREDNRMQQLVIANDFLHFLTFSQWEDSCKRIESAIQHRRKLYLQELDELSSISLEKQKKKKKEKNELKSHEEDDEKYIIQTTEEGTEWRGIAECGGEGEKKEGREGRKGRGIWQEGDPLYFLQSHPGVAGTTGETDDRRNEKKRKKDKKKRDEYVNGYESNDGKYVTYTPANNSDREPTYSCHDIIKFNEEKRKKNMDAFYDSTHNNIWGGGKYSALDVIKLRCLLQLSKGLQTLKNSTEDLPSPSCNIIEKKGMQNEKNIDTKKEEKKKKSMFKNKKNLKEIKNDKNDSLYYEQRLTYLPHSRRKSMRKEPYSSDIDSASSNNISVFSSSSVFSPSSPPLSPPSASPSPSSPSSPFFSSVSSSNSSVAFPFSLNNKRTEGKRQRKKNKNDESIDLFNSCINTFISSFSSSRLENDRRFLLHHRLGIARARAIALYYKNKSEKKKTKRNKEEKQHKMNEEKASAEELAEEIVSDIDTETTIGELKTKKKKEKLYEILTRKKKNNKQKRKEKKMIDIYDAERIWGIREDMLSEKEWMQIIKMWILNSKKTLIHQIEKYDRLIYLIHLSNSIVKKWQFVPRDVEETLQSLQKKFPPCCFFKFDPLLSIHTYIPPVNLPPVSSLHDMLYTYNNNNSNASVCTNTTNNNIIINQNTYNINNFNNDEMLKRINLKRSCKKTATHIKSLHASLYTNENKTNSNIPLHQKTKEKNILAETKDDNGKEKGKERAEKEKINNENITRTVNITDIYALGSAPIFSSSDEGNDEKLISSKTKGQRNRFDGKENERQKDAKERKAKEKKKREAKEKKKEKNDTKAGEEEEQQEDTDTEDEQCLRTKNKTKEKDKIKHFVEKNDSSDLRKKKQNGHHSTNNNDANTTKNRALLKTHNLNNIQKKKTSSVKNVNRKKRASVSSVSSSVFSSEEKTEEKKKNKKEEMKSNDTEKAWVSIFQPAFVVSSSSCSRSPFYPHPECPSSVQTCEEERKIANIIDGGNVKEQVFDTQNVPSSFIENLPSLSPIKKTFSPPDVFYKKMQDKIDKKRRDFTSSGWTGKSKEKINEEMRNDDETISMHEPLVAKPQLGRKKAYQKRAEEKYQAIERARYDDQAEKRKKKHSINSGSDVSSEKENSCSPEEGKEEESETGVQRKMIGTNRKKLDEKEDIGFVLLEEEEQSDWSIHSISSPPTFSPPPISPAGSPFSSPFSPPLSPLSVISSPKEEKNETESEEKKTDGIYPHDEKALDLEKDRDNKKNEKRKYDDKNDLSLVSSFSSSPPPQFPIAFPDSFTGISDGVSTPAFPDDSCDNSRHNSNNSNKNIKEKTSLATGNNDNRDFSPIQENVMEKQTNEASGIPCSKEEAVHAGKEENTKFKLHETTPTEKEKHESKNDFMQEFTPEAEDKKNKKRKRKKKKSANTEKILKDAPAEEENVGKGKDVNNSVDSGFDNKINESESYNRNYCDASRVTSDTSSRGKNGKINLETKKEEFQGEKTNSDEKDEEEEKDEKGDEAKDEKGDEAKDEESNKNETQTREKSLKQKEMPEMETKNATKNEDMFLVENKPEEECDNYVEQEKINKAEGKEQKIKRDVKSENKQLNLTEKREEASAAETAVMKEKSEKEGTKTSRKEKKKKTCKMARRRSKKGRKT